MRGTRRRRRADQRGFTLVEILVVVAIIAMLAAVGIVQILRARIVTHEQLALVSLRHIAKTCHFFYLANQRYPADLSELGAPASNPPYLDAQLVGGTKQGYQFVYDSEPDAPSPATRFTLLANPVTYGVTGVRHFYTDQSLVIYFTTLDQLATAGDPVVP
jgi:prepilin-type N-terminal cleavage/methylation domain-containing protein